ncbi:PEP-CTERM sorting domain-containing protein [Noviherbaspirillum sp. ST9]|uniref:PEP-CTERM sorting domain-containing protein n=1 Tax=Noviherbaspirillum sp. ST9 TaxID=3401606 RepID=UPI003B5861CA
MFKRFIATGVAACAGLVLSVASLPAAAYTLDVKIGQTLSGNSGDATELAAIEAITGQDLELDSKVDISTAAQNPGTLDQWFIDVAPDTPGFFAVKFGIGGLNVAADTFFFQNIAELTKLVFSDAQVLGITGMSGCRNCNIERISHYTTFSGGETHVPEPLPLTLLGIGMAGMWLSRRQRRGDTQA